MSILGIFDIGKTALFATRRALDTVAHNVANSGTPGYTRQDVVLENAAAGTISSAGVTGRGVKLVEVQRMYDSFINLQLKNERSNLAYWNEYEKNTLKIENIFNEAGESGLNSAITGFFNAWHDVSQAPEGYAQRTLLMKRAEYLSSRLNRAYTALDDERTEILQSSTSLVNEVNTLTAKVADLNEKIATSPGALDLRDQRDELLAQLNEIVKVSSFEDNSGRFNVLLGGTPLVDGGKTFEMTVSTDINNDMSFYVEIKDLSGALTEPPRNVTTSILGGQLKANLDLRDERITDYFNKLNIFTINFADAVNYLHKQGFGLDNSTGENFFTSTLSLPESSEVISSASITSTMLDTFTIDGTNQTIYYNLGGLDLSFDLAEGTYTADELAAEVKAKLETATIATNNKFTVTYDTSSKKFTIKNLNIAGGASVDLLWENSGTTAAEIFGFSGDHASIVADGSSDTSDSPASSAAVDSVDYIFNRYTITYNPTNPAGEGAEDFTITYGSSSKKVAAILTTDTGEFGRSLEFNGIKIRIEGNLTAGDSFEVQLNQHAAKEIAVALSDTNKVAASVSTFEISSSNNTFVFNEGNGTITTVVPMGTYTGDELAAALKAALESADATTSNTYTVVYNSSIKKFKIDSADTPLDLIWASSVLDAEMGFSNVNTRNYDESDNVVGWPITITATVNDQIVFNEGNGNQTATIAAAAYANPADIDTLRAAIKTALEDADLTVHDTYTVLYDTSSNHFKIVNNSGNGSLELRWADVASTAAGVLGFAAANTTGIPDSFVSNNPVSLQATKSLPGDNRNSKAIADLVSQSIIAGRTPVDFYREIVSDVGVDSLAARDSLNFQRTLVDELDRRREELSGVSLDEEAANLIKYQKSYEAAAKLISVADELLDILLNMTGRR